MYEIVRSLSSQHGSYNEGDIDSLHKVPKSIRDAWEKQGVIRKRKLPQMDKTKRDNNKDSEDG